MSTLLEQLEKRGVLPSAHVMGVLRECSGMLVLAAKVAKEGVSDDSSPAAESGDRVHQKLAGNTNVKLSIAEEDSYEGCSAIEGTVTKMVFGADASQAVLRETRFWYRIGFQAVFSAQIDCAKANHVTSQALLINYKTGRVMEDEAPDNLQSETEVVAFSNAFGSGIKDIYSVVIQPLSSWKPDIAHYTEELQEAAEIRITEIVDKAIYNPVLNGGPWCGKCPIRMRCAVGISAALKRWKDAQSIEKAVEHLPYGKEADAYYEMLGGAVSVLEGIKDFMRDRLVEDPASMIAYGANEGNRQIENVGAMRSLMMTWGISEIDIDKALSCSITKVQALAAKKFGWTGKEATENFNRLMQPLLTRGEPVVRQLGKVKLQEKLRMLEGNQKVLSES